MKNINFKNNEFGFSVEVLDASIEPNKNVYLAMHTCYSDEDVRTTGLSEKACGEIIVKRLLNGGRGHYSPFEMATIQIGFYGIPHSTTQQLLRSRIGLSPSVQSYRYTSKYFVDVPNNLELIEKLIYLRPVGEYQGRDGNLFKYTKRMRDEDLFKCGCMLSHASLRVSEGMAPEQARGIIPFDYRQNMTITFNARSIMAVLDRRYKKDAQLEIQALSQLLLLCFKTWMPEVALWYDRNRLGKAILSP